MFYLNRLSPTLILGLLVISSCQTINTTAIKQTSSQGLCPNAPTYALHGPFAVGYKQLTAGKGTDHPLEISLWYPALNPKGIDEKMTYVIKHKDATWSPKQQAIVYGHAILNAQIDGSHGPYPLVVFSHGFSACTSVYNVLLEHYASYGFIVIAPDHTEQFDKSWSDLWKASIDRPRDIKQTLDYAESLTASDGTMAGMIDMAHVAVVGHSYGGYTALAMAGAQYDLIAYNARCARVTEDDPLSILCSPLVPKEKDMATRAGYTSISQGLWSSFGDPRVKAIIPMAGDSYLFDKLGLSKITIPMMAMGGTADTGTPYEWGAKPSYEYASSEQKALVTFIGAEHMIFNTPCESQPRAKDNPGYDFFCFDPVWDRARAMDLICHFSTAFLLDMLKGDQDAHKVLLPDKVNFPGIEYKTTLK